MESVSRFSGRTLELVVHVGAAAVALLLLLAVCQPIVTDDLWWHLALGDAWLSGGPWLAADPLLHTAVNPPAPASWLSDIVLFVIANAYGFAGLRVTHGIGVVAILLLCWSLLRNASGSRVAASLGTTVFAVLACYRLVQLRPHLFTILATLVLYRLLLERRDAPSGRRVAGAVALLLLWVNVHGAFLLGPLLLAAALAVCLAAAVLRGEFRAVRARVRVLGFALALGLFATLLNPGGFTPYLAYFSAGLTTPGLERVADEWARFPLLAGPRELLPPSPLSWALIWIMLIATPVAALRAAARWRTDPAAGPDPALVGLALASLAAALVAARFAWLGIFPLLLFASHWKRAGWDARAGPTWVGATAMLLLVGAFPVFSAWPMTSRALSIASYGQPYRPAKYRAHAVWLLADAQLEGRLYNDYFSGGFLGFWLAPNLRQFVNGSLNVPIEVMDDARSMREARGARPGEDLLALLDRYGVDVFIGIGLPAAHVAGRPWFYTTAHLERAPGWIPIFRSLQSAVYLRANERNRENLERVAEYYRREKVPFDPARGFEVARVVRRAPLWAIWHGLVPVDFSELRSAANGLDPLLRETSLRRLGPLYAALGLYERALEVDRQVRPDGPDANAARRRIVWSLLHLGRQDEARNAAAELASGRLSARLVAAANDTDAVVSRLPVFTRFEARVLAASVVPPPARTEKPQPAPR